MIEQVYRFISTIEGKTSHWILENETSIDIAEKMCLQFLQQLGNMRANAQQAQQVAEQAKKAEENKEENQDVKS